LSVPWSSKSQDDVLSPADLFLRIKNSNGQSELTSLAGITSSSNAPKLLHVLTQADLETQFGVNIEIPDGESWTIAIDDSFTLTKPFKIGLNSSLELVGSSISLILTYTGTGALFQNETFANQIFALTVRQLEIHGDNTNDLLNLNLSFNVIFFNTTMEEFDSIGLIETLFYEFRFTSFHGITGGLIVQKGTSGILVSFNIDQPPASNPFVFLTIIDDGTVSQLTMADCFVSDNKAKVLFIDPNVSAGSLFIINNTLGDFDELFNSGVGTVTVTNVVDFAGAARFQTSGSHGLSIDDLILMSGFTEPSYNGLHRVTATPTGSEFMLDGTSLDSTDVPVRAVSNKDSQASMFTGATGLEVFGAEVTTTINTINVPEVVTSASWAFSNLERFSISVNNEGKLASDDPATIRYTVSYSGTIEKVGGGSVDVGIVILKNGVNVSFNAPHTVNTGKIQISASDIIELAPGDTIQIGVINYADTSNIDVSQLGMVISI